MERVLQKEFQDRFMSAMHYKSGDGLSSFLETYYDKLNPHERARILSIAGFIEVNRDDENDALKSPEVMEQMRKMILPLFD